MSNGQPEESLHQGTCDVSQGLDETVKNTGNAEARKVWSADSVVLIPVPDVRCLSYYSARRRSAGPDTNDVEADLERRDCLTVTSRGALDSGLHTQGFPCLPVLPKSHELAPGGSPPHAACIRHGMTACDERELRPVSCPLYHRAPSYLRSHAMPRATFSRALRLPHTQVPPTHAPHSHPPPPPLFSSTPATPLRTSSTAFGAFNVSKSRRAAALPWRASAATAPIV